MALIDKAKINERIDATEVRLISEDGEQLGIVSIEDAMKRADDVGLDLMEVSPNTDPPVCRIVNFGKLKYEKKKKIQTSRKKQHVIKVKEIRLRPKIGDHDFDTKVNNMGRKFLKEGFKLKVTIMFRGREISRLDLGEDLLNRVADALEDIAEPEGKTDLEGRRISVYFNAI
ncbi:MAG: translation initiation factor IF-3 [Candidatus Marinimicrobia bacterium]|nr:translation initiation factor IF-3 [Candidatus Neomarinimicrobiota bacterium]MBS00090.1 translation initiation factor IF-3 [Candidatus Neomarinimicrobiota bacterium]